MTGTRGKSTVTRLIAGALKEDGLRVLAKTTGSKPVLIHPDGSEKEIQRHGTPSILEGKGVLSTAVQQRTQAVVIEMMSIRPELMYVESVRVFRPHILVITNTRLDHTEQMGTSKEEIAACFAAAIPGQCTVFVPDKEFFPVYQEKADSVNSKVVSVPKEAYKKDLEAQKNKSPFVRDVQLALAVSEFLDISKNVALSGLNRIQPDFGSLKAWKSKEDGLLEGCLFISAFAANEPESTRWVLDHLKAKGIFNRKKLAALLNFRSDRGDRTLQWMHALKKGFLSGFDRIILLGEHAPIIIKKMRSGFGQPEYIALQSGSPADITADAVPQGRESVVVGMGNMGGLGKELIQYWEAIGEPYDL